MNSFFRKNTVIGLAEVFCRLPLIFTVGYLARSIGTTNFGNWAVILACQVFVAGFAGLGLSSSLSRFIPAKEPGETAAYLRYSFVLALGPLLVATMLLYVLQGPIGRLLSIRGDLLWLLPVAVLMAAGSTADGFLDAYFKACMAVGRQVCYVAARTLAEVIAVVLVFVITPAFLDGVSMRLAAYVVVLVAGKAAIYPWLLLGAAKGERLPPRNLRGEFVGYGLPMVPAVLVIWLIAQSDRLVLTNFVSKAELGVYAFAASLAAYTVYLGYAVFPLLLPAASKLYDAGDANGVQTLFRSCQNLYVTLWAAAMACLAMWSAEVITWTGGHAYVGASHILIILCFAVGIDRVIGVYQFSFHLVKRTDLIFWLNLGNAGLLIVGLWIAAATKGIVLVPWAVLAATLIFNVLRYQVALHYVHVAIEYILLVKLVFVAGLVAVLARYASEWSIDVRVAVTALIVVPLGLYAIRRHFLSGLSGGENWLFG